MFSEKDQCNLYIYIKYVYMYDNCVIKFVFLKRCHLRKWHSERRAIRLVGDFENTKKRQELCFHSDKFDLQRVLKVTFVIILQRKSDSITWYSYHY